MTERQDRTGFELRTGSGISSPERNQFNAIGVAKEHFFEEYNPTNLVENETIPYCKKLLIFGNILMMKIKGLIIIGVVVSLLIILAAVLSCYVVDFYTCQDLPWCSHIYIDDPVEGPSGDCEFFLGL